MNKPIQQCLWVSERIVTRGYRSRFQLFTSQRNLSTSRHQRRETIPAFLLPSFAPQGLSAKASPRRDLAPRASSDRIITPQRHCYFSTSSRQEAVVVAANPRKDDEGNDMLVDITPRAAKVRLEDAFHLDPTNIPLLAAQRHHDQRLEPRPPPPRLRPIRRLPRFPISHVSRLFVRRIERGRHSVRSERWVRRKGGDGRTELGVVEREQC